MRSHIVGLTKRFWYFGTTKYHAPGKERKKNDIVCLLNESRPADSRKDAEINPIAIGSA